MLRRWRDPAVAALLAALALVPALDTMGAQFGDLPHRAATWFTVVLDVALVLPLAVRSRWPALCLAVVGPAFGLYEALSYPPQFATVAVYLALYSVGALQQRLRAVIAVIATLAYVALALTVHHRGSPDQLGDYLVFYGALTLPWALGAYVRTRRVQEAERLRLTAEAATAAERSRIARELHDVVTHHVTAMVVQADATQYVAESPDRVVTAMRGILGTGRRALTDLRSLLDVLEEPASVADLVEQTRRSGQPVDLVLEGDLRRVAVPVQLIVYRVVQEGLTNAVKYAAGRPTTVEVTTSAHEIDVLVTNVASTSSPPAGLSGGRGLPGLQDRLDALGGKLTAGPLPDGGFLLQAMIPLRSDT